MNVDQSQWESQVRRTADREHADGTPTAPDQAPGTPADVDAARTARAVEFERRLRTACAQAMTGPETPANVRRAVHGALARFPDSFPFRAPAISGRARRLRNWAALAASLLIVAVTAAEGRRLLNPYLVLVPGAQINSDAVVRLVSDLTDTHESWAATRPTHPDSRSPVLDARAGAAWLQREHLPLPNDPNVRLASVRTFEHDQLGRAAALHFTVGTHDQPDDVVDQATVVYMLDDGDLPLRDGVSFRVPADNVCFNLCQRDGLTIFTLSGSQRACGRIMEALGLPKTSAMLVLNGRAH